MKRVPILIPLLVMVGALFLGILVFVWVEAKKANPQVVYSGAGLLPCRRLSSRRAARKRGGSPEGLPHV
jgi:hypothetical protein